MNSTNKVTTIIERIKWHSSRLNDQEKEMLRDELLTIMLFKDLNEGRTQVQPANDNYIGLTEAEKSLIKKLADQADKLFKLSGDGEKPNP